jgi:hypothetical protein
MTFEVDKALAAGQMRQSTDRQFGLVMAGFFFLCTLGSAWKHGWVPLWRWPILSLSFLLCALVFPVVLHPLNLAWTLLGKILHKVMSPLVMGVLYFGFFTPFGFLFRLIKGDPLRLKLDPKLDTYWITRDEKDQPGGGMANQF